MTIEWLAGNRIRGTNSERTTTTGFNTVAATSGGWVELGRHTLGAASDYLEVSSLPEKRYYKMIWHIIDGTASWCQPGWRVGSGTVDTGGNYGERFTRDGAADTVYGNNTYNGLWANAASANTDLFGVSYFTNHSAKEKLAIHHTVGSAAGAASAPSRGEIVGKWANTSNPLDLVRLEHVGTGNGYNTNSECVIMGWDPADAHTTNFWEELASVNASGSSTNLSSGTITAKKYLWIQCYSEGTSGDILTTFNNDSGSNYGRRYSIDGASDATSVSQASIANMHNAGLAGDDAFSNWFIINNSANEKFCTGHSVQNGAAGAATVPLRVEFVGKWANTSSQITEIDFDSQSGNFGSNSIIKVWGSD